MKNDNQWIKPRHLVVRNLAYYLMYPYARMKYGVEIIKQKDEKPRQYLIVLNHQTPFDQFFLGMAVKGAIYYVATEDIFSMGWISSLIRYLVAPIPIRKQTTDLQAVKTCIRVAREGGTIAIAPEGNRTYSGRTEYMNPAIASLARKLGLPIMIFRIEGGYGVEPRWSDVKRRGKMRAYPARIIEPEEYAGWTNEQLYEEIRDGLYVDEAKLSGEFHHRKSAEYLERAIYICPYCGFAKHESRGQYMQCTRCGRQVRYLPTKELKGVGFDFPFRFVAGWYDYQCDFMNDTNTAALTEQPVFEDAAALFEVLAFKKKIALEKKVKIRLYGDRLELEREEGLWVLPYSELLAITVLGRNKANIYYDGRIFQLKGDKHFNALKYVHFYHRYKNIIKGDSNGKFLGL